MFENLGILKLRGDRTIWLIVGILTLLSMMVVYSATGTLAYKARGGNTEYFLLKHGALALFGFSAIAQWCRGTMRVDVSDFFRMHIRIF